MDSTVLKFFLLEDDPVDQELIKRTLKKSFDNCAITIASDKSDFFNMLEWSTPDIIISDYNLPGFNGLEALLHIKEKYPHIPFVFVTGMLEDEEKVAGAILKGAAGYLLKENVRQLPDLLKELLHKYQQYSNEQESILQKKRQSRILYQKLRALLENASDFPERQDALAIIDKLAED